MKTSEVRLCGVGLPFLIVPALGFAFSQVPYWIVGPEGRTLFSQLLTQLITGILDALLLLFTNVLFLSGG